MSGNQAELEGGGSSGSTTTPEAGGVTITKDEQGTAFATAVYSFGITANFGTMSAEDQQKFWNAQAYKYMGASWDGTDANVDAFLSDIGLERGNSVNVQYMAAGDLIVSDSPVLPYDGDEEFTIETETGEYTLRITQTEDVVYGTAWGNPTVFGSRTVWEILITKPDGSTQNYGIISSAASETFFNGRYPDDDYAVIKSEYWFSNSSSGSLQINYRSSCDRKYSRHLGYGTAGYETLYDPSKTGYRTNSVNITGLDELQKTIVFSWDEGGGGGGGGGSDYRNKFAAFAGVSGRHADPLRGTYIYKPTKRTEKPPYGCGGFGGHGGGGGAGASTVIIRKFTKNGQTVETVAVAKRHGYGSAGGEGGSGGDGCILVFW